MLLFYLRQVSHQGLRGGAGGEQCLVLFLFFPPLVFGRRPVFVRPRKPLTTLNLLPAGGVQEIRTVLLGEEEWSGFDILPDNRF